MTETMISTAHATGEEIFEIASRIEPALIGVPRGHAVISMLSIAITIMNPDISPEKLQEGVKGASEWICLFLADDPSQGQEPVLLN